MSVERRPKAKCGAFVVVSRRVKRFFALMGAVHREQVVELTRHEARELENLFVLLLMGSLTGFPAPPTFLAARLLPFLEHELSVVNRRAVEASDVLAELTGCLDVD